MNTYLADAVSETTKKNFYQMHEYMTRKHYFFKDSRDIVESTENGWTVWRGISKFENVPIEFHERRTNDKVEWLFDEYYMTEEERGCFYL